MLIVLLFPQDGEAKLYLIPIARYIVDRTKWQIHSNHGITYS